MKPLQYSQFKHGQRVRCKIDGEQIDDAKISINEDGAIYICQNKTDGDAADNKLGYDYSWQIFYRNKKPLSSIDEITDLIFLDRTIEDVQEGDVVVNKTDINPKGQLVLGICGKCVFLSYVDVHEDYRHTRTKQDLKDSGYIIKQDTPPTITEVTLQEVADKMGVPVEQLRIKE